MNLIPRFIVTIALLCSAIACRSSAPAGPSAEASGAVATETAQPSEASGSQAENASGEAPAAAVQPAGATSLLVYCGRNEEMLRPLFERYQQETGVTINAQFAGSAELAATLLEEGDRTRADVFFAQDVSTLGLLESQGRLETLPADVLDRVGANFRSNTGVWVGTSGRARVLVYNTEYFAANPLPADLDALLNPALRGRIGWAPENASFQSFVAALVAERGEEGTRQWLTAMHALQPQAYPSNTPLVAAAGRGEIVAGLTNHYYLFRVQAENNQQLPVANHYFRNERAESLVNAAGVGVLKTSANKDAAVAFIRWMLSDSVQTYFAQQTFEFPLVGSVAADALLPPLSALGVPPTDLGALGDLEVASRLLRETGILQ